MLCVFVSSTSTSSIRSYYGSADISGWYDGKKRLAHIMHIE